MIFVGKSPYRISLLGGGSDLDWFVKDNNYGICFGYALQKYSYSVLNVLPSEATKGILEYSTREDYSSIEEIVHPIIREVIDDLKISKFIELKTFGFASGGSGLGGSASFMISLIAALSKAFSITITNQEIVERACLIELEKLNKPIGKQDQYLCGNDGLNSFTFYADDSVKTNRISLNKKLLLEKLTDDFYLIPTNKKRNSDSVLSQIKKDNRSIDKIIEIREIANKFLLFDDERDYKIEEKFHQSIRDSWQIKKSISHVMTESLNAQYELINNLIPNNWIRLLGAGSGGYFLISSKIKKDKLFSLASEKGVKGLFQAKISQEGISSYEL